MDKKLNGFNNGRDTTDGVGGGESLEENMKWCADNMEVKDDSKDRERMEAELNYRYGGDLKKSIEVLCNALREDTSEGSYYYSLQANIAMQFKDEFWKTYRSMSRYYVDFEDKMLVDEDKIHEISNEAAKNFLNLLIKK